MLFDEKSLEEVVDKIVQNYLQNNGALKFNKLVKKVLTNDKLCGLLSRSRYQCSPIPAKTLLSCMNSSLDFMFISTNAQMCAATLFYARWNEEVNKELEICSERWIVNEIRACYQIFNLI